MRKIGLLGGSFDPPHRGHLYISLEAKKFFSLDEVWWLVTPTNPLKISKPAKYDERVYNCKNIVKNQPILIKEYEKKINSKYTYYSLNYLLNHYSNIKFFWLMGADNLINFHEWQKWKQIFNKIPIVIFRRHGYNSKALNSIAYKTFNIYRLEESQISEDSFDNNPSWIILNNKEIRVSSSEIRKQRQILRG